MSFALDPWDADWYDRARPPASNAPDLCPRCGAYWQCDCNAYAVVNESDGIRALWRANRSIDVPLIQRTARMFNLDDAACICGRTPPSPQYWCEHCPRKGLHIAKPPQGLS